MQYNRACIQNKATSPLLGHQGLFLMKYIYFFSKSIHFPSSFNTL